MLLCFGLLFLCVLSVVLATAGCVCCHSTFDVSLNVITSTAISPLVVVRVCLTNSPYLCLPLASLHWGCKLVVLLRWNESEIRHSSPTPTAQCSQRRRRKAMQATDLTNYDQDEQIQNENVCASLEAKSIADTTLAGVYCVFLVVCPLKSSIESLQ
jgi:hypothetical protein